MIFNATEELKNITQYIEEKLPTDLLDYFKEKTTFLNNNGITRDMHVGKTDFKTLDHASEFLLGQFIGIIEKGKENKIYYSAFSNWLKHVYHFVIDNKANLI